MMLEQEVSYVRLTRGFITDVYKLVQEGAKKKFNHEHRQEGARVKVTFLKVSVLR